MASDSASPAAEGEMPSACAANAGRLASIGKSTPMRSTVAVRQTAVRPLSVANAQTPITTTTTSALRLPPPTRTRALLGQPDDSTMPKPKRAPPTSADNQIQRLAAYSVPAGSTRPAQASSPKPIVAVPAARPHCRMRVQSPMVATSLTAPMVQNPVFWTSAPNPRDTKKEAQSTCRVSRLSSSMVIFRF